MTTTERPPTSPAAGTPTSPSEGAEAFAERVFAAVLGAQEVQAVYLGGRLALYAALATSGWTTPTELAAATRTAERYVREWLEHQAVAGYLEVEDPDADDADRRFRLPAEHAEVLADPDSVAFTAPLADLTVSVGRQMDALVDAYRTGEGVGWHAHGDGARRAQAAANRPLFLHQLSQQHLSAIPEVHAVLAGDGHVADIGSGGGWSSIGIALAYPGVTVDGYDLDGPSVVMARRNATEHGVADRVRFHEMDVADLAVDRPYDAAFAFECIHDMSDPVGVLSGIRRMVAPGAPVVVMDERVAESFSVDAGPVERLMYGFSITCCLPDGLSRQPSAATGTVMRPSTLDAYAREAGFDRAEPTGEENDFFRFYRLPH